MKIVVNEELCKRLKYILLFIRTKRKLSQEELAQAIGVSRTTVTALESACDKQKVSTNNLLQILLGLGIDLRFTEDKGLFDILPEEYKNNVSEIICAILDYYCYSLTEDLATKLGGKDGIVTSERMKEIIMSLSKEQREQIFKTPAEKTVPYILANIEYWQARLINYLAEEDPFFKLLNFLGINLPDVIKDIFMIEQYVTRLKTASLKNLYENFEKVKEIEKILCELVKR